MSEPFRWGSDSQLVGAFGERAVEAELLRRGWFTSNVNQSVKNAPHFDLFAQRDGRLVCLRVKTSGPSQRAFQFNTKIGQKLPERKLGDYDYTILVHMGAESRAQDEFFILPTHKVWKAINRWRSKFLSVETKDGSPLKDKGHWTLRLDDLQSGERRLNYGFRRKWRSYLDNWNILADV